jgi:hypothetical protein
MLFRIIQTGLIILIMILLTLVTSDALGQSDTITLSGTVSSLEADLEEPLTGATIRLFTLPDSVMVRGTASGPQGEFQIRSVEPGNYYLSFTYVGYHPVDQNLENLNQNLDDLHVVLRSSAIELDEFRVTARRPRVEVRGDTTAFHADGYQTNPDASAEDLVNRMPGFVMENGRLQAQGEEVSRVLVDGREFFGDDAALTLRNLPAEIIEQIEVFDELSEQAQFTGFNDGNTQRTLNIVTRGGMSNGQFGRIGSGYGTVTRYSAGGNYNYFDDDRRISIIGLSNNVNQQNFSSEDLIGVSEAGSGGRGGRGRGGRGGGGGGGGNVGNFLVGNQNGINSVHSTGLNYVDKWGDSWEVNGSYFFNITNNVNDQYIERRYLSGFSADQLYDEDAYDTSENYNHRFNMRMEYEIDDRRSLLFTPRMSFQSNNRNSMIQGLTFDQGTILLNQIESQNRLNNSGYDISNRILYRHRFETRGRTFSANFRTDFDDRTGERYQFDQSLFYGEDSNSIVVDQQMEILTGGYSLSADFSFTEPVSERSQLMVSYQPSLNQNNSIQDAFIFNEETGRYDILESNLSNRYENRVLANRVRGSYRFRGESYNLDFNLGWQHTSLTGEQVYPIVFDASRNWQNLLPGATFQYRFENNSSIRLSYDTRTRTPSARQLQDVIDNSNPLRMTTGNSDLDQQYEHRFRLRYRAANSERGTSTMAFVSMDYVTNHIGNRTFTAGEDLEVSPGIILGRGARLISPDNIGTSWNLRTFVNRSMPVDLISSNLNLNGGVTFRRTPSYIDESMNISDTFSFNAGSVISSNINENIDFRASYRANYNIVDNSINPLIDNNYYSGRASGNFNVMPWRGLVLSSDVNYRHYAGLGNDFNQNMMYWNGSIGYKFLENRAAELRMHVFDILAQNNNIDRAITEDYIEDFRTNVLTRFVMMSFSYNFRSFSGR